MLRIALILTILAGLGAIGLTHVKVGGHIEALTGERDQAQTDRDSALQAQGKAEKDAATAKEAEQKANDAVADLTTKLETTSRNLTVQQKRANDLETQLNTTTQSRNEAQQELAAWRALSIPVDRIRSQLAELVAVKEEREALLGEKDVLVRNNTLLQGEVDRYKGLSTDVALPAGLKGKVLAVDPRFEFVVLNIGRKDGALEMGKLMVSREGKLVGKVQLTRVDETRSIANVLPEWKQADLVEGDDVLY